MENNISVNILRLYFSYFSINELKLIEQKIIQCKVSKDEVVICSKKKPKVIIDSEESKHKLLKLIENAINCSYKEKYSKKAIS